MSEEKEKIQWSLQADMLVNRIKKNKKKLKNWLQKEKISSYRLYDRDIPELPFVIDSYKDQLHIAEFHRPMHKNDETSERWRCQIMDHLCKSLQIPESSLYLKRRERQKGANQYSRFAKQGERFTVNEGGHRFWVNLSDYLDTGLFLDHRMTRKMIQKEAEGKRFLNLFSYTGAFTVYAARGGATKTTTVDLSNTYLQWAKENLDLNALKSKDHHFVQADVFSFLQKITMENETFDLAVLDPPTFSNSKRMEGILDIQEDHVWLINQVLANLSPRGVMYFSTNFRKFHFRSNEIHCSEISEITEKTIPRDFRDKKIHRCWKINKKVVKSHKSL